MKKYNIVLLAMPFILASCSNDLSFNKVSETKYSNESSYNEFLEAYNKTDDFATDVVRNRNFYTLKYVSNGSSVINFKSGNKSLASQSEVSNFEINSEVDANNRNLKISKKRLKEEKISTAKYQGVENSIYDITYYFQYIEPATIGTLFYNFYPDTNCYSKSTYAASDPYDALLIKASDSNTISNYFKSYSDATDKENYSFYMDDVIATAKYAYTKTEEQKKSDEVYANQVKEIVNIQQINITKDKMSILHNTYSKTTRTYTKDYVDSGIFVSAGDVCETVNETSKYYEISLKDSLNVEKFAAADFTLITE